MSARQTESDRFKLEPRKRERAPDSHPVRNAEPSRERLRPNAHPPRTAPDLRAAAKVAAAFVQPTNQVIRTGLFAV